MYIETIFVQIAWCTLMILDVLMICISKVLIIGHGFKTMNQRGCRIWNSMPADLKQIISKSSFGKKYKNWLVGQMSSAK